MLVSISCEAQAAIVDFGLLLDMNPAHADAHYGRALAHSTLGHHQVWRRYLCACCFGGRTAQTAGRINDRA